MTQDERFRAAGLGAFRYERALFNSAAGGWPDFRLGQDGAGGPIVAWCNGATGIGISRLRAAELLPAEPDLLPEADVAMQAAIRVLSSPLTPGAMDLSYCHGLAGHADFLLQVSMYLNRGEFRDLADRFGTFCLTQFHDTGLPFPCGVPNGGPSPTLMLGTAGIGHFLLRLLAVDEVPSALIVRPAIGKES